MKKDLFDLMFIPRDALLKECNITINGTGRVFVEGFEAIKELSGERLRLRVRNGTVVISGNDMYVEYFGEGEIMVRGAISDVSMLKP